jgi:hypothetical protein
VQRATHCTARRRDLESLFCTSRLLVEGRRGTCQIRECEGYFDRGTMRAFPGMVKARNNYRRTTSVVGSKAFFDNSLYESRWQIPYRNTRQSATTVLPQSRPAYELLRQHRWSYEIATFFSRKRREDDCVVNSIWTSERTRTQHQLPRTILRNSTTRVKLQTIRSRGRFLSNESRTQGNSTI